MAPSPIRTPALPGLLLSLSLLFTTTRAAGAGEAPEGSGRSPRAVASAQGTLPTGSGAAPKNGAPKSGGVPAAPRIVEVRLGISPAAAEGLAETRMRRLIELELGEKAVLAPGTSGPLGEHVAYVWIDLPNASTVAIEVRVGDRQVVRRELGIIGLSWDVAARIVAITTSEMVQAQMRPVRVQRRAPVPKGPTPEELEIASRSRDALVFHAAAEGAALPSSSAVLVGPSLELGLRRFGASERLFGAWLLGPAEPGAMRWLEVGLGVDYRVWLSRSWRVALGARAAFAFVHLDGPRSVDGVAGSESALSGRAAGALGVEARLHGPMWLGLSFEPGAVLRPVRYVDEAGGEGAIKGLWLGASLSLSIEWIASAEGAGAR
jgi:hypothetical protein